MPEDEDELRRQAEQFANELTNTVRGVVGRDTPPFQAVYENGGRRLVITTFASDSELPPPITITIGNVPRLELSLTLKGVWDGAKDYLAIEESKAAVRMAGGKAEPLFRWEYIRHPKSNIPGAHFQIHAHRDEVVYMLLTGRRANRRIKDRVNQLDSPRPRIPQLSNLHFPVGGPRFRPCLEDVLQFLVEEFGIDCEENWKKVLCEGRRGWRRMQTGVVVRDCPDEAVRVLRDLGYKIEEPDEKPPVSHKLIMY
ncbi:hypothetical protein [Actinomadura sp. BRA 177]|uniref:hypothetical protein n=1 Tax=Actinomadura sp. BRA 177 TaxID=2745202 RepID=UPI001595D57B|nr:hypothetical protein [Actinomadura sp. BRA 177]NVI89229.1 hypothetical protein [Actinomadura sp. BRA 177]